MKNFGLTAVVSAVLICICGVQHLALGNGSIPDFKWTMVNVNSTDQQGDAHLIRIKNGKTILIDTGHSEPAEISLIPFLSQESIDEIDMVFISHPHLDHYGGLEVLLENNIKVGEVHFNLPLRSVCDQEIPWGCDYQDIISLQQNLKNKGIPTRQVVSGESFDLGGYTKIEVLYAFDGINTPVGSADVNDLSLIMMLYHREFKFLFSGDLNWRIGGYLDSVPEDLSADVLKVPHHGVESAAPNSFFSKVSPRFALVPAPEKLWRSSRSKRIRKWFKTRKVPLFVNGIDGNVHVVVDGDDLTIRTQKDDESS